MGLAADLACALDPVAFARRRGYEPDPKQAEVIRCKSRHLLVCTSRQWGKSTTAALSGAHDLRYGAPRPIGKKLQQPFVLIAAPTQRQSDETFAKLREMVADSLDDVSEYEVRRETDLRPAFVRKPGRRAVLEAHADVWNVRELRLKGGARGVCVPGVPENIRGFAGVTKAIVDEAAFAPDTLFTAITPMLKVSRGAIWLLSTPNGQQGYFWDKWENGGEHYARIRVTVEDNPRIDPADVELDRADLPLSQFLQEYYCQFTERMGAVFTDEQIRGFLAGTGESAWAL
jgi:hypothetical protein